MTGEILFGAFCVAWLTIGGILLTMQMFLRLRGIDRLRRLQGDEMRLMLDIEADTRAAEHDAERVEMDSRNLRRLIQAMERRLELTSALHVATVTIPAYAKASAGKPVRAEILEPASPTILKLPRRHRFE